MEYRPLGRTGIRVSSLCLGTAFRAQDDEATCVHPGWPMLRGWSGIRESWERIFNNTGSFQVRLSDVNVRFEETTAWVTCIEKSFT